MNNYNLEIALKFHRDVLDLIDSIIAQTSHHDKTDEQIDQEEILWTMVSLKIKDIEEELKNGS